MPGLVALPMILELQDNGVSGACCLDYSTYVALGSLKVLDQCLPGETLENTKHLICLLPKIPHTYKCITF